MNINLVALEFAKARARELVTNPSMGALSEAYAEIAARAIQDYLEYNKNGELKYGHSVDEIWQNYQAHENKGGE